MFRRPLHLSVILAVVTGLLAVAAPAHAAPVSPQLTITIDAWNQAPTREYGTYVPITAQTRGTNGFNGVPGSFEVRRNGAWVSRGWTSTGSFAAGLWEEDPAGTYEFDFEFVPDDTATYLPETKTVTIVRPKAPQGLDLGTPPTDVQAGGSWTLPEPNPANARLAVRAGSTAGACAVSARRVDFTGAGTCTVDVTADEDANHFAAAPRAVTFQVTQAPTVTDVGWSAPSVVIDEPVDLRIALKAGADLVDGSAEVWLGGQRRATVALDGGAADWRTSFPSPGSYEVEVRGTPTDPGYAPSTGRATIQVDRRSQAISAPPSPAYVGDTWRPTASGGGSVSVSSRTTPVCDVVDGQVAFRAAGTCQVDSSAARTATHEADERSDSFSVVGVPADVEVTLVPLTTSSQRVEIEVASVRGTPAGTVTFNGTLAKALVDGRASWTTSGRSPGTALRVEIGYTPTAGSTWAAGTTVRDLVVPKVPQPVTISAPPADPRIGQTWTPTVTFTSTPMTASWQVSGACAREGVLVRFTAAGDCTISARHAGGTDYLEGTATRTFAVGRISRAFSASPAPAYVEDTWSPTVTGPGAVTATSTTPAVCTAAGGTVTFQATGSCVVDLSASASPEYDAASERRTLAVTLVPITVELGLRSFGPQEHRVTVSLTSPRGTPTGRVSLSLPGSTQGALLDGAGQASFDYARTATAGSSLAWSVVTTSVGEKWAQGSGTGSVRVVGYEQRGVSIAAPSATPRIGGTWTPDLTWSTSGRPASWTATGACTRVGDAVSFTAVGDCTVTAVQSAGDGYLEGRAERTVTVDRALQSISATPDPAYVDDTWTPTSAGGGAVTLTSTTPAICTVTGAAVTWKAAGSCGLDLSAPGTSTYLPVNQHRTIAVSAVPVTMTSRGSASGPRSTVTVMLSSPRDTPTGTVVFTVGGTQRQEVVLVDGVASADFHYLWSAGDQYRVRVAYRPDNGRWTAVDHSVIGDVLEEQPITIAAPTATARVGDAWTPAVAWYSSPQERSWTVAGACVREQDAVRFTAAGACTVTAVQAGDSMFVEGRAQRVVTVEKGLQPISFTNAAPTTAYVGGWWVPLATGGPSGRPVEVDAGPRAICDVVATVEGGVATPAVRFRAAGECTVTFVQRGTADYEAGERSVTLPVALLPVDLTLTPDDDLTVGAEGTLEVGATAGGQVVPGEVTVEGGGISVSGSVGDGPAELPVTFDHAGTHQLTVSFEPADPATYAAAEDEVDVVVAKGAQTITTGRQPPETALVGDSWRPSFTGGGSGEPIAIEASGACERAGTLIRFTAAGTCTLTVDQPGNADWLAAPTVTTSTEVGLVPVDVTVTVPDDARVGEATALDVVTSAPGTVEVVVDGQTLTGSGPTLPVTFTRAGEREAEVSFTPADPATHQSYAGSTTLAVAKGAQQLALSEVAPATRRAGGVWTPAASGGDSGSPVLVAAAPEAVCAAESGTVRFDSAGDCEVTLTQAGSADYEPAPELRRTVAVERRTPTLTVTLPDDARVGEPAVVTARSDEDGVVRFALDGEIVGPATVTDGVATATLLPTSAGERLVTATFTPAAPGAVAGGEREVTLDVGRAATGTDVTVAADGVTATVSPTHTAAGVPTGEVVFSAGDRELGRADLVDGVATLDRPLDPDWAGEVTASYAGDAARAASRGSARRVLPTIVASVRAQRPAVRGWYDAPVVVEFACAPGSAAVVTCPAPVEVGEGRSQAVTREVSAADGARATVTVGDVSVDTTRPEVAVRGVRAGAVVKGRARATCRAVDAGSGLASCRLAHRREGGSWVVVATATDRAGHTSVTRVRYRQARAWVPFRPAGEVGTVTRGERIRLVVLTGGARPVVTGPLGRSADVVRVRRVRGLTRWHVGVRFPEHAERGASYRVRVRGGGTDEVVRFRVR